MYMPYLHGKQEELLALVALSPSLGDLVVPIIKPVNLDPTNTTARLARIGANARYAIVTNSDKGPNRQPPPYTEVAQLIDSAPIAANAASVFPAFEIRGGTLIAAFDRFSREFADRRCIVIHKGHTFSAAQLSGAMHFVVDPVHVYVEPGVPMGAFSALPSAANIVVRNGFQACERNADYPDRSAFDDLVYRYSSRNLQGFGDFSMIGDTYSPGGGPARAVAIHLTEDLGQSLAMNHFVSTSVGVDTQTMYFEALDRLVAYGATKAPVYMSTAGAKEYVRSNADRHFPNLGPAKRWSTMHHIETVQRILASRNAAASF
jgi:hypothetical protein